MTNTDNLPRWLELAAQSIRLGLPDRAIRDLNRALGLANSLKRRDIAGRIMTAINHAKRVPFAPKAETKGFRPRDYQNVFLAQIDESHTFKFEKEPPDYYVFGVEGGKIIESHGVMSADEAAALAKSKNTRNL